MTFWDVCIFRYVTYGSDRDIRNLLEEKPAQKGVICNDQVSLTSLLFGKIIAIHMHLFHDLNGEMRVSWSYLCDVKDILVTSE